VQIASGFLVHPKLFLLDEPFDGLDITQARDITNVMNEEEEKTAILVSSHRLDIIERLADNIIVLNQGQVFVSGELEEVCSTLCPTSVAILIPQEQRSQIDTIAEQLKREFTTLVVTVAGQTITLCGQADEPCIKAFLEQKSLTNFSSITARPSLFDAMNYFLRK